jgi:HEAT repeat protein
MRFFKPNVSKMERKRDAAGLMRACIEDGDWHVRSDAARALGEVGDTRSVETLIRALEDRESSVRYYAAGALGKIGDARSVEPLIRALEDSGETFRSNAAEALGEIGDARSVEPLIAALDRWCYETGKKGFAYTALCSEWGALHALVKLGSPAVEPLHLALSSGRSINLRTFAARALGQIGDARSVEPLIGALEDPASDVRESAIAALVDIGKAALGPLKRAIENRQSADLKDRSLRLYAGMALEKVSYLHPRLHS